MGNNITTDNALNQIAKDIEFYDLDPEEVIEIWIKVLLEKIERNRKGVH